MLRRNLKILEIIYRLIFLAIFYLSYGIILPIHNLLFLCSYLLLWSSSLCKHRMPCLCRSIFLFFLYFIICSLNLIQIIKIVLHQFKVGISPWDFILALFNLLQFSLHLCFLPFDIIRIWSVLSIATSSNNNENKQNYSCNNNDYKEI